MSMRLRELIRLIRNAKTADEERAIVAKECAAIRAAFKEQSPRRARNVAKLMYIHMLGYPTEFGQMECINLIVSPQYPEKRIGYLALMILLDETQEVLPLIEHSLKKDLHDQSQFIQALALTAVANIASEDICRDLSPDVEKLLFHSAYVRKKAALCAVRIVSKCPELVENYAEVVERLLREKSHAVVLTAVTLVSEIVRTRKKWRVHFRKLIPALVKKLRSLLVSSYALDHDIHGISDPFLQCAILRLMRLLAKGDQKASEAITDIIVQVMTNTEGGKNTGNSVLYECTKTILDIPGDQGLRNLATNQLGKFLVSKDNNLRFVALQLMTKVVLDLKDHAAVTRHINTIVECLKDYDIAIKMRALELISALVNRQNIKFLASEIIGYLQVTPDGGFKEALATRLCEAVERYSPSNEYQIATLLRVITLAGQYVRENVANTFLGLVTQVPQLQQRITKNLYQAVESLIHKPRLLVRQQTLLQVTAWCVGEYADQIVGDGEITEEQILELMKQLLESSYVGTICRHYLITCLAKLSERFPRQAETAKHLIAQYRDNMDIEIQQRSVEYSNMFQWTEAKSAALDKMPPVPMELINRMAYSLTLDSIEESEEDKGEADESEEAADDESRKTNGKSAQDLISVDDIMQFGNERTQESETGNLLLDLLDVPSPAPDTSSPQSTASAGTAKPPAQVVESLDDLLGLGGSSGGDAPVAPAVTQPSTSSSQAASSPLSNLDDLFAGTGPTTQPSPDISETRATMSVFKKDGLVIDFEVRKPNPSSATYQIIVYFSNESVTSLVDFDFLAAVPRYIQMQIFKPSSSTIPALSDRQVSQKIRLTNNMDGTKPLAMKFKVQYKREGTGIQVTEQGSVTNWPGNL